MNRAGIVDGADQNGLGVVLCEVIASQGQRALISAIQRRAIVHWRDERSSAGIGDGAALNVRPVDQLDCGVRANDGNVGVFVHHGDVELQRAAAGGFNQPEVGDVVVDAQRCSGSVGVDYARRLVGDDQTVVANLPRAFDQVIDVDERAGVGVVQDGLARGSLIHDDRAPTGQSHRTAERQEWRC